MTPSESGESSSSAPGDPNRVRDRLSGGQGGGQRANPAVESLEQLDVARLGHHQQVGQAECEHGHDQNGHHPAGDRGDEEAGEQAAEQDQVTLPAAAAGRAAGQSSPDAGDAFGPA
jgi:hypothetical protein